MKGDGGQAKTGHKTMKKNPSYGGAGANVTQSRLNSGGFKGSRGKVRSVRGTKNMSRSSEA